jgi:hypothetical protein
VVVQMGRRVEVGEDVSGYDLHPTSAGALLAVSAEESFKECVVHEGGALAMLPDGSVLCSFNCDMWNVMHDLLAASGSAPDMMEVMRERALQGYLLDPDRNAELCARMGYKDLVGAWTLVARLLSAQPVQADGKPDTDRPVPAAAALQQRDSKQLGNPAPDADATGGGGGGGGGGEAGRGGVGNEAGHWGVWGVLAISEVCKDISSARISKTLVRMPHGPCSTALAAPASSALNTSAASTASNASAMHGLPHPSRLSSSASSFTRALFPCLLYPLALRQVRRLRLPGGCIQSACVCMCCLRVRGQGHCAPACVCVCVLLARGVDERLLSYSPRSPLPRDRDGLVVSGRSETSQLRAGMNAEGMNAEGAGAVGGEGGGSGSEGQPFVVVEVYVSEARRRILHVCEYDFGEEARFDLEMDYEGSEALEKRVTQLDRKHMHAHAAFTRLLQVDLSSALECLYKGAGFEGTSAGGGGGAGGGVGGAGGGAGASYAMAAVAMAGWVHQILNDDC